ncbi:hypothetical protein N9390_04520 [Gammaproteobacteria bacterium]|nr:hypothetical protein [Gammaproteobacteria bacterium]
MAAKENLLKDLCQYLESAETFLNQVEEAEMIAPDLIREYQMDLVMLQNKHIPPEMCSDGKLIERIMEVETLLDNLKRELENSDDSE